MADTFGAATFNIIAQSIQISGPSKVTVHEIPGGDNFYVDLGGKGARTLTCDVYLASDAALQAILNERDNSGTLVYYAGSKAAVLKTANAKPDQEWDAASGAFVQTASLEFILL